MSRTIVFIATVIALTACGCNTAQQPPATDGGSKSSTKSAPTQLSTKPATGGVASGSNTDPGILPMGGGAMTPVTNPGAVDGAGSGIGEAAKNAAKSAAERASQTTAGDASSSDGDN